MKDPFFIHPVFVTQWNIMVYPVFYCNLKTLATLGSQSEKVIQIW